MRLQRLVLATISAAVIVAGEASSIVSQEDAGSTQLSESEGDIPPLSIITVEPSSTTSVSQSLLDILHLSIITVAPSSTTSVSQSLLDILHLSIITVEPSSSTTSVSQSLLDILHLSIITVYPSSSTTSVSQSLLEILHLSIITVEPSHTTQKPPSPSHGPGEPQIQPPKPLTSTLTGTPTDVSSQQTTPTTLEKHSSSVDIATPLVTTFEQAASFTGVSKLAACIVLAISLVF